MIRKNCGQPHTPSTARHSPVEPSGLPTVFQNPRWRPLAPPAVHHRFTRDTEHRRFIRCLTEIVLTPVSHRKVSHALFLLDRFNRALPRSHGPLTASSARLVRNRGNARTGSRAARVWHFVSEPEEVNVPCPEIALRSKAP